MARTGPRRLRIELRARVETAIAAAPDGWVIDGNYRSKLDDIVLAQADTLVWLELPMRISLVRSRPPDVEALAHRRGALARKP